MNGIQHLTTPTCLKFCLGIMLFIWPQLLKIWPQLSPVWPQLLSFGERDGDNFFTARANPGISACPVTGLSSPPRPTRFPLLFVHND